MRLHSVLTVLVINICLSVSEDYYQLLGISRDADNREIRKAFKKLALKLHPDKNDAKDAHEKFLKINRAYEILKDEETRKKYDLHGEKGFESMGQRGYQSWSYYHEDFGIYDDDPEIVTLDSADFQRSVLESHDIWFINFYSPRCGHCHDLAPTWRRFAKQMEGVIRIGAVNCQDEFMLCRRQGVSGYPTLYLYTTGEGTKEFEGRREEEDLQEFISRFLPERVITLWPGNFDKWVKGEEARAGPWLMILCSEDDGCPDPLSRKLVGASLTGLASVAMVDCDADAHLCQQLRSMVATKGSEEASLLYFPDRVVKGEGEVVAASLTDQREMARAVLDRLPGPARLDDTAFQEMRRRLAKEMGPGWLVQFVQQEKGDSSEYKKLVALVPRLRIGRVDCSEERVICRDLHLTKFPSFVVFKVGGDYEIHYGKPSIQDVAAFARLSVQARTLRTLATGDFPDVITNGEPVFIDFFAPWCPPCMNLLPEFRKASTLIGGSVHFGTVDCTVHQRVCNQHGINAYPTTIFFNQSRPHRYHGSHSADELAEFVQDVLRPTIVELTGENFDQLVGKKTEDEVWLVDYFAPWCGPCQQLAPHWRTLGRLLEKLTHIKLGKVDCEEERELCHRQGVRSYPTIRLYPLGSRGSNRYTPYTQYHRDAESLHQWVHASLPSIVDTLTPYEFQHQVLRSSQPWLVEFYAPWCSHCVEFAPQYEQVAFSLKGVAKVGKVNCDKYRQLCSQAGITGYPTIRFYRGVDKYEVEDYYSENINTREPAQIVRIVEESIKQSQLPGAKPNTNHAKPNAGQRDEL